MIGRRMWAMALGDLGTVTKRLPDLGTEQEDH